MMLLNLIFLTFKARAWNYATQASWTGNCAMADTSPKPLDPTEATKISSSLQMKMVFLGFTGSQVIINTGNTIRITSSLGYIEVGDMSGRRTFNVKYIEFHTPSEHKIGGTFFPIEMQIVCTIMDRYWDRVLPNLAIVSVIIQKGKESYFFNTLQINKWPTQAGTNYTLTNTSNINLREIVSNTDQYWHYNGTATNPDLLCQSNVLWYIIQDVKEAAEWQVNILKNLFPSGNSKALVEMSPTLYYSFSLTLKILGLLLML